MAVLRWLQFSSRLLLGSSRSRGAPAQDFPSECLVLAMHFHCRTLPDGTSAMHMASERGNEELAAFLAPDLEGWQQAVTCDGEGRRPFFRCAKVSSGAEVDKVGLACAWGCP